LHRAYLVIVSLLMNGVLMRASEINDRIESAARQSYLFETCLQGDDIRIQSKDGAVTLTGVVAENFHKALAQENVACLPGVKSVNNRMTLEQSNSKN
jgi:hyperosmotically inducible periplasmic protein